MSIIVEDGSGRLDSESYSTVAEFTSWALKMGYAVGNPSSDLVEQALRRATQFIEGEYRTRWPGYKRIYRQALAWPRSNVVDEDGVSVPYDSIPLAVKKACLEATKRELLSPNSLSPDFVAARAVKSKSVGPLSKTYFGTGTAKDVKPVLTVIDNLLSGLLSSNVGSSRYSGSAVRG